MGWELTAWLVPMAFWLCLAAVILIPLWLRSRERGWLHETLRIAYENGDPVTADFVRTLGERERERAEGPRSTAEWDARRAVLFIAAGLGAAVLAYALSIARTAEDEISATIDFGLAIGASGILAFIGIIHFGFWIFRRGDRPRGRAQGPDAR
ncbi:MAG TPA: hypothetical protein VII73_08175 [Caulobacteraceae bacterium]